MSVPTTTWPTAMPQITARHTDGKTVGAPARFASTFRVWVGVCTSAGTPGGGYTGVTTTGMPSSTAVPVT